MGQQLQLFTDFKCKHLKNEGRREYRSEEGAGEKGKEGNEKYTLAFWKESRIENWTVLVTGDMTHYFM